MPWEPGGNFNRLYSWVSDASAGYDILADRIDGDTNDIVQGLMRTVNLDGLTAAAANLPMGGFKHTNVGLAVSPTDYARYDQVVKTDASGNGSISGNLTVTGGVTALGVTAGSDGIVCSGPIAGSSTMAVTGGITTASGITASGLIQGANLQSTGDSYVGNNLTVTAGVSAAGVTAGANGVISNGNLQVNGNTYLGVTSVSGGLSAGSISCSGGLSAGSITCNGNFNGTGGSNAFSGPLSVGGGLTVSGAGSSFTQGLVVNTQPGQLDALQVNGGNLSIGQDSNGNSLFVGAVAHFSGYAYFENGVRIEGGGNLDLYTYAWLNGGCTVGGGDLHVDGNLYVSGSYPLLAPPADPLAEGEILLLSRGADPRWQRVHMGTPDANGWRALYVTDDGRGEEPDAQPAPPATRPGTQNF